MASFDLSPFMCVPRRAIVSIYSSAMLTSMHVQPNQRSNTLLFHEAPRPA